MTAATPPQTKYCRFLSLDTGIWLFTFIDASNRAVDEWYQWQTYLKENPIPTDDDHVRMLLDLRESGPIPLLYSLQQGREWRKKYPDLRNFRVLIALLLKQFPRYQQPYVKLIKDGVNLFTLGQVEVEIFFDDQTKAIDWLLNA